MTRVNKQSLLKITDLASNSSTFDYKSLNESERLLIQQRTNEIKEHLRSAIQVAWEIGQKLVEVRAYLDYGQFDKWLKAEFKWSRRTAYNYIRVFESFDSCATIAQANLTASALYLLAAPSTPETARTEALFLARQGENITYSKAKSLVNQHKKAQKSKITLRQMLEQQQANAILPIKTSASGESLSENPSKLLTVDVTKQIDIQPEQINESSSQNPTNNTNEIYMTLINQVESLKEEQVVALVKALAQHWSEQLIYTLSDIMK